MKPTSLYSYLLGLLLALKPSECFQSVKNSSQRASSSIHAEPSNDCSVSRRTINNSLFSTVASSLIISPQVSRAEEVSVEPRTVVQGTVSLAAGIQFPPESLPSTSSSAIYLTCRPDKPDNVPAAILNGSRGKAPPVLAARIENPTFPLDFSLISPRDLTIEGAATLNSADNGQSLDFDNFWWIKEDLIVSARWDSDGVAATRAPEDLVGRVVWKNGESKVQLELGGRGAFGKYVTGSKK
ncbi:MAG: hypothetical protein SGBAC_012857 [Bacillariaceae sp.]